MSPKELLSGEIALPCYDGHQHSSSSKGEVEFVSAALKFGCCWDFDQWNAAEGTLRFLRTQEAFRLLYSSLGHNSYHVTMTRA